MISLSQLLELAGKATKGPWRAMRDGNQYINGDANLLCGASRIEELTRPHNPWYVKPLHELESVSRFLDKDADFIAAANPETVTALVNEVIKLREELWAIGEYWNGDFNEQATGDMASYATKTARQALSKSMERMKA